MFVSKWNNLTESLVRRNKLTKMIYKIKLYQKNYMLHSLMFVHIKDCLPPAITSITISIMSISIVWQINDMRMTVASIIAIIITCRSSSMDAWNYIYLTRTQFNNNNYYYYYYYYYFNYLDMGLEWEWAKFVDDHMMYIHLLFESKLVLVLWHVIHNSSLTKFPMKTTNLKTFLKSISKCLEKTKLEKLFRR